MYRWLHMLDMAITPAMVRQALTPETDSEVAEALLRYFVRRREPSDVNRDKTEPDCDIFSIAILACRDNGKQSGYGLDGALPLSPFEIALIEILADTGRAFAAGGARAIAAAIRSVAAKEIARFRDFNALIDSGIIGRVRELKQWLDASFYHPGVLATVSALQRCFRKTI